MGTSTARHPYRQAFIEELADALGGQPHLRLLLSIRQDSLDDLSRYQQDLGNPVTYAVRPLAAAAAVEAMQRRIEQTGYSLIPGVAEELVGNLRFSALPNAQSLSGAPADHDVEPALLQAVCAGFWAAFLRGVHRIGFHELHQYGDVSQLLTRFCARAAGSVADQQGRSAAELRSWLQRTFTTESGTRNTAYEGQAETAGMPNAVVRALEDWHVLKAIRRSGRRRYELQHDCLVGPVRRANEAPESRTAVPDRASAADHLRAAEAALADGDLALAERQATAAVHETDDTDLRLRAETESLLGNVEHVRKNPAKAEDRYRKAAALFEALQDTSAVARQLAAIGQSLLAQGRPAEAVEKLYASIRRLPNDLTVQTELGQALWQQGRPCRCGRRAHRGPDPGGRPLPWTRSGPAAKSWPTLRRGQEKAPAGPGPGSPPSVRPPVQAARALGAGRAAPAGSRGRGNWPPHSPRRRSNGQVLLYAARVGALGGDRVMAANLARRAEAADEVRPCPLINSSRRANGQRVGHAADEAGRVLNGLRLRPWAGRHRARSRA